MPENPNLPDRTGNSIKRDTVDFPPLTFDGDDYTHLIEDADLSEEQQREFLEILWNIVVTFVDLGFGIEATQQVLLAHFADYLDDKEKEDITE